MADIAETLHKFNCFKDNDPLAIQQTMRIECHKKFKIYINYLSGYLNLSSNLMNISPIKKVGELKSEYNFRAVVFCTKCSIIFGVSFGLMLILRPNVENALLPFVSMFLWLGISMAFAASVIALLGYLVGWRFSLFLESNETANHNWPKIKIIGAAIILTPVCCFSLYWFFRGLFTMEVLAVKRHGGFNLIHSSESAFLFWYSILFWGVMGLFGPFQILKTIIKNFNK